LVLAKKGSKILATIDSLALDALETLKELESLKELTSFRKFD
jgi:hypothetical protein